jgi:hypothetical protein
MLMLTEVLGPSFIAVSIRMRMKHRLDARDNQSEKACGKHERE